MQVSKWGNSLAIRIPAALVEELGLKEGDEVVVRRAEDGALEIARKPGTDEWLARIREMGPLLPKDFKFDRERLYPKRRGGTGSDD